MTVRPCRRGDLDAKELEQTLAIKHARELGVSLSTESWR